MRYRNITLSKRAKKNKDALQSVKGCQYIIKILKGLNIIIRNSVFKNPIIDRRSLNKNDIF